MTLVSRNLSVESFIPLLGTDFSGIAGPTFLCKAGHISGRFPTISTTLESASMLGS